MLNYPVAEHRLGNGLRVVASPEAAVPSVATCLVYNVGSADEVPGATGLAHLFEHLTFKGSRDVADGEHVWLVQAHGGGCNATTDADLTSYYNQLPAGGLDLALWLEANKMATFHEALSQTALDNQRAVIREEKNQRFGGPFGSALERRLAMLFPPRHPYHHSPIGSGGDLEAAGLDDVSAFFSTYYAPDNAVLAVVGDVAPEAVFASAERYFGAIPAGDERPRRPGNFDFEPLSAPAHQYVPEAGAPFPLLELAFRLPPDSATNTDIWACDTALHTVARRTFHRLVRTEGIAHNVDAEVDPRRLTSIGTITVSIVPGQSPSAAESALLQELDRLADKGPTQAELDRWNARSERMVLTHLASLLGRAGALAAFTAVFDAPDSINTGVDRIRAVDADQVQRVADRWLRPNSRTGIAFQPAPAAPSTPATADA